MTAATSNAAATDAGQELAQPLERTSMTYVRRERRRRTMTTSDLQFEEERGVSPDCESGV
jgi:hypothetical protein